MLTEKDLENALTELLYDGDVYTSEDAVRIESVIPFGQAGLMTNNAGVEIRLSDGSEFQLSINRSR